MTELFIQFSQKCFSCHLHSCPQCFTCLFTFWTVWKIYFDILHKKIFFVSHWKNLHAHKTLFFPRSNLQIHMSPTIHLHTSDCHIKYKWLWHVCVFRLITPVEFNSVNSYILYMRMHINVNRMWQRERFSVKWFKILSADHFSEQACCTCITLMEIDVKSRQLFCIVSCYTSCHACSKIIFVKILNWLDWEMEFFGLLTVIYVSIWFDVDWFV